MPQYIVVWATGDFLKFISANLKLLLLALSLLARVPRIVSERQIESGH